MKEHDLNQQEKTQVVRVTVIRGLACLLSVVCLSGLGWVGDPWENAKQ